MKAICGIEIDKDKTFLAVAQTGKSYQFLGEEEIPLLYQHDTLSQHLSSNAELIAAKIEECEKKFSVKVDKIFLTIFSDDVYEKFVQETVSLPNKGNLSQRKISFVKKYVEDVSLNWDEVCLHHLPISYEINGSFFKVAPEGIDARKITLQSQLIWSKEKIKTHLVKTLCNLAYQYGGIVWAPLAALASCVSTIDKNNRYCVLFLRYQTADFIIYDKGKIKVISCPRVCVEQLIKMVETHFLLSLDLAEQIFNRYVSFSKRRIDSTQKDIRIKVENKYLSIDTYALSTFLKSYLHQEIGKVFKENFTDDLLEGLNFSILGRCNHFEGFYEFIKGILPEKVTFLPAKKSMQSSLYGALFYAYFPYFEQPAKEEKTPILQRLKNVYQEYF